MPVCVAQTVQKGTVRDAIIHHDGYLVSVACHLAPLAAQPPPSPLARHARLERPPERHFGGCAGAWAQSGRLSRQAACRGRCLVGSKSLSLTGPCRDAWRVAASSLRCLGWPSRQAPLAGALSPWSEYFVLEWLQRNHEGPWRSPDKPCRGALRLPVHKFGILGYPYSSTPT